MTQLSIHLTEPICREEKNEMIETKCHRLRAVRGEKKTNKNILNFEGEGE